MPIPPGVCGVALGLSGAASVLLELVGDGPWATACTVSSASLWLVFTVDRAWHPVASEWHTPATLSAYGAYEMTFLFVWTRLVPIAEPGIWLGAVAQLVILAAFLRACRLHGVLPEPLYNPPTVNCAVTAVVAAPLNLARLRGLTLGSFVFAVLLAALFVPAQVYRVAKDDAVSASAAIAMLQAPWSLNALTWGVMRRSFSAPILGRRADALVAHVLFAASTLVFVLTLAFGWRRRAAIRKRGFGLDWAAFTFPSCSTAVTALQFASNVSSPVARVYAVALAIVVLAVVAGVVGRAAALAVRAFFASGITSPDDESPEVPPPKEGGEQQQQGSGQQQNDDQPPQRDAADQALSSSQLQLVEGGHKPQQER